MISGNEQAPRVSRSRWSIIGLAGITAFTLAVGGCGFGRQGPDGERFGEPGERMTRMVDRVLSSVDASDAQKAKINGIAQRALAEMKPQRDSMRAARTAGLDLLSAPTIDRAAIEQLRKNQVSEVDKSSTILSTAMSDVAEVLTPEQRVQLREKMQARMDRGRHGHGWWGRG